MKPTSPPQFSLGNFRPLYLWGGKATVRMLRLKFMGANVDEKAHEFVHALEGAERVAEMDFNWVFLAYNWGFPPEIEEQDWADFESALNHYHKYNLKVFGYIQASNCVFAGTYQQKDWYALDYYGHKIPFYTGRYFTSLAHAGWLAEVRERVRKLAKLGADGIFFDNPWQGGIGITVANMPLGFIGSYDPHSRKAYAEDYGGAEIPLVWDVTHPETQQYIRWRGQLAVKALRDWSQTARDINPQVVICANNFDAVVHNTYVDMGMDLAGLSTVQDVLMVENFSLPRIQEDQAVVANAITIGASQTVSQKAPITTNPLVNGIGFDRMFHPRQFSRMIAEGIAANAPTIVRGTTYLHRGEYTLLLHRRYEKQRATLASMNHWLEKHQGWINQRQPIAPLAVYYPYSALHWHWQSIAPVFFALCQTLILKGYPLRIVGEVDDWAEVKTLLLPPGDVPDLDEHLAQFIQGGGQVIPVGTARSSISKDTIWANWQPIRHHVPNWRWLRKRINHGAILSWRAYHEFRFVRWLAETLKFHLQTTQSPLYFVPPAKYQDELIGAIQHVNLPRITEHEQPLLLTGWREPDGTQQWHLLNYADAPQRITFDLNRLVKADLYAVGEDSPPNQIIGSALMMTVDVAKIVRIPPEGQT
jgi:hypothetical protein